jgi:hypothetical protein
MRQQTRASKEPAEKVVQDIRRATRKHYSAEEKIRIVCREIDAAYAALARERPDALFVAPDAFFNSRCVQLAILAAHDR